MPSEAGGDVRNARSILVSTLRGFSGIAANSRSTHSALPTLTSNRVKIINGKGAACNI